MDKKELIGALVTIFVGLLTFVFKELPDWIQRRTKGAKENAAIDFAQRRVTFLSAWLDARQKAATSKSIAAIKKTVAEELDTIKKGVDEILQAESEKSLQESRKSQQKEQLSKSYPELPFSDSILTYSLIIGLFGSIFPFIVPLIAFSLNRTGILNSLSAYYYTKARSVYEILLFGIGIFLILYKGRTKLEGFAGFFGGILAIGMTLIPLPISISPNVANSASSSIHYIISIGFFFIAIFFPLSWAARMSRYPPDTLDKPRKLRIRIYKICGYLMLACVILLAIVGVIPLSDEYHSTFWLEAIIYFAFGISWLTRGRAFDALASKSIKPKQ